jgi:hypothetical protein
MTDSDLERCAIGNRRRKARYTVRFLAGRAITPNCGVRNAWCSIVHTHLG